MQHTGFISDKPVSSKADFIVLSHTHGILSEHYSIENARRALRESKASSASWGQRCDGAIFQWTGFGWKALGSLYDDLEPATAGRAYAPSRKWS